MIITYYHFKCTIGAIYPSYSLCLVSLCYYYCYECNLNPIINTYRPLISLMECVLKL